MRLSPKFPMERVQEENRARFQTLARHVQQDFVRQHFPHSSAKDEMLEKMRGDLEAS